MRGMKSKSQPFVLYHVFRCFHWVILFGMAVACGLLTALEGDSTPAYFPMSLAAAICLFVEACYLAFDRWQVSLAYLIFATTYVALTAGTTVAIFNLTRYLLGE